VTRAAFVVGLLGLLVSAPALASDPHLAVSWKPARPRPGDVAWLTVRGAPAGATLEGSVGGRPVAFFAYAGGHAAVVGFDVETGPRELTWRIGVIDDAAAPRNASGKVRLLRRDFSVQRLSLPQGMVDLDPETERRAVDEGQRLQTLYRTVTPERLWRGRFVRPVGGTDAGTGFGSRRIINGKPRAPHTGIDYSVERGTPVVAVNDGRVALVADFFFPGRLVVLDHGLGLYTLYFHLDAVTAEEGLRVSRGQPIGTVGSTGRATGPHLHFGALAGGARIDPAVLIALDVLD
jgi:murein DD-endopeptidase MepM/ murein hydrolase activator NlpD